MTTMTSTDEPTGAKVPDTVSHEQEQLATTPAVSSDPTPSEPAPASPITTTAAAIEPEFDGVDGDSSFGDNDAATDYTSVSSSIYNFRQENGRTYHAYEEGKYLLPNDEREQERMDITYHSMLILFDGKPFFAPVTNPQKIVDWGTGTGIWALDVADQYPEAHVIGIDLSPIQPKWVAPNVEFRIDDLEKPWILDTDFDLVHSRLCKGNAIRDTAKYMAEAYRTLKPGGWIELQESDMNAVTDDNSLPPDNPIAQWHENMHKGMMIAGCNLRGGSKELREAVEAAGFINVHVVDFKLPLSPWAKDPQLKKVGGLAMMSVLDGLSGMSMAVFTRILGWSTLELEIFISQVNAEWRKASIHAYWPVFVVYGQKPLAATTTKAE